MFDEEYNSFKEHIFNCPNCQGQIPDLPTIITTKFKCPICEVIIDLETGKYSYPSKYYQTESIFHQPIPLSLKLEDIGKIDSTQVKIIAFSRFQQVFQKYVGVSFDKNYVPNARIEEIFELQDSNTEKIAYYLIKTKQGFILQEPIIIPYPPIPEAFQKLELNFFNPNQPKSITEYGYGKLIWNSGNRLKPDNFNFYRYEDNTNYWFSVELADDKSAIYFRERRIKPYELRSYFPRLTILNNERLRFLQFIRNISLIGGLALGLLLGLSILLPKKIVFEQAFTFGVENDSIPQISKEWVMKPGIYLMEMTVEFAQMGSEIYSVVDLYDGNDLKINEIGVDFWAESGYWESGERWEDKNTYVYKYFYINEANNYSIEINNFQNPRKTYQTSGKIFFKIREAGLIWYYFLYPIIFSNLVLIINQALINECKK
jgi:hypothetical protein